MSGTEKDVVFAYYRTTPAFAWKHQVKPHQVSWSVQVAPCLGFELRTFRIEVNRTAVSLNVHVITQCFLGYFYLLYCVVYK